jgi:hypothetical protein
MKDQINRRSFLRVAGMSLGTGVLYEFAPFLSRHAEADAINDFFKRANGEAPQSFTFAQFSDPHVGFQGPPDPLGTKAFEGAVDLINKAPRRPDLVLFTGDLTHDTDKPGEHAQRMQLFKTISSRINTPALHCVPGENDAALDGGVHGTLAFPRQCAITPSVPPASPLIWTMAAPLKTPRQWLRMRAPAPRSYTIGPTIRLPSPRLRKLESKTNFSAAKKQNVRPGRVDEDSEGINPIRETPFVWSSFRITP